LTCVFRPDEVIGPTWACAGVIVRNVRNMISAMCRVRMNCGECEKGEIENRLVITEFTVVSNSLGFTNLVNASIHRVGGLHRLDIVKSQHDEVYFIMWTPAQLASANRSPKQASFDSCKDWRNCCINELSLGSQVSPGSQSGAVACALTCM